MAKSEARLKSEAEAVGATAEDAPIIEMVEERHAAFEAAQAKHESVRHHGIFIGGAAALGAVPAALLNTWTAAPFLLNLGAKVTVGLKTPDAVPLDRWIPYIYFQSEILRYLEVVSLVGAPPNTLEPRLI